MFQLYRLNRSIANISAIPGAAKSLTLIKTLTASSSGTLSFVDGTSSVVLDNTYKEYLFTFKDIHPGTQSKFSFNGSIDSGSNYNVAKTSTFFYAYHEEAAGAQLLEKRTDFDLGPVSYTHLRAHET